MDNCTEFFDVGVHQVRAVSPGSPPGTPRQTAPPELRLEPEELTILMSWAEAIAEVLASAPERLHRSLAEADSDGTWRAEMGIEELSPALGQSIDAMRRLLSNSAPSGLERPLEEALAVVRAARPGDGEHEILARRALRSALEQRRTRHQKLGLSASPPQRR